MRYKHFKNAGADISALTVGTWGIAGANSAGVSWGDVDTKESIAAVRRMVENGVNMVDTAPIYRGRTLRGGRWTGVKRDQG